jgi:hypothetical protein
MMMCNLKHFLAAMRRNSLPEVHRNLGIFRNKLLAKILALEAYIAGSANWKISLAGSSPMID